MTRARSPGRGDRLARLTARGVREAGFTLLELLLAIALVSVIMLGVTSLLAATFESFRSAEERIACRAYLRDALHDLIEGGFRAPGLRDAAALLEARADRVRFVAPLLETLHPGRDGVHPLARRFHPGASPPTFEVRRDGRWVAHPARVAFDYKRNEVVVPAVLLDREGLALRYLADPESAPSTVFEVGRDARSKHLVRRRGSQRDVLSGRTLGIDEARLQLRYFDRLGRELETEGGALGAGQRAAVASVEVGLEVRRGDTRAGDVRRVDLFNGGERVLLRRAGVELRGIEPEEARAGMRLGNLHGADPGERVHLRADAWSADIVFGDAGSATATLEIAGKNLAPMTVPFHVSEGLQLSSPDRRVDRGGGENPEPGSELRFFRTDDHVRFEDDDGDGRFGPGDELYWDRGDDGRFDEGSDVILVGTRVGDGVASFSAADARVPLRYADRRGDGRFQPGDALILDENLDGRFGGQFLDDAGFSRPFGLRVETFEIDGATLFLP